MVKKWTVYFTIYYYYCYLIFIMIYKSILASASEDKTVLLYELKSGRPVIFINIIKNLI